MINNFIFMIKPHGRIPSQLFNGTLYVHLILVFLFLSNNNLIIIAEAKKQ